MSEIKSNSFSSVSLESFGIDVDKPLLSGLGLTRIDPNCSSHDSGVERAW